jgi:hypothetical protein
MPARDTVAESLFCQWRQVVSANRENTSWKGNPAVFTAFYS